MPDEVIDKQKANHEDNKAINLPRGKICKKNYKEVSLEDDAAMMTNTRSKTRMLLIVEGVRGMERYKQGAVRVGTEILIPKENLGNNTCMSQLPQLVTLRMK